MRKCPNCGNACEEGLFCDACGTNLSAEANLDVNVDTEPKVQNDVEPKMEEPSIKKYIILGSVIVVVAILAVVLVFLTSSFRKTGQEESQETGDNQQTSEVDDSGSNVAEDEKSDTEKEELSISDEVDHLGMGNEAELDVSLETTTPTPEPQSTYRYVIRDCSWWEAHEECAAMGGHLVHFDTPGEFERVIADFTSKGYGDRSKFWIGGARNNSDIYYWIHSDGTFGEAISLDDSHWMKDEPSYKDPGLNDLIENRMILYYYQNEWVYNDEADNLLDYIPRYSGTIGYICEFEN